MFYEAENDNCIIYTVTKYREQCYFNRTQLLVLSCFIEQVAVRLTYVVASLVEVSSFWAVLCVLLVKRSCYLLLVAFSICYAYMYECFLVCVSASSLINYTHSWALSGNFCSFPSTESCISFSCLSKKFIEASEENL